MWFGRKKYLKIPVSAAREIMRLSAPATSETRCLECGGEGARTSPQYYDHKPGCRGVARDEAVMEIVKNAAKSRLR